MANYYYPHRKAWIQWNCSYVDTTATIIWAGWNHHHYGTSTASVTGLDYWPIWNEVYGNRNRGWREILRGARKPVSAEERARWRESEREFERKAAEERERRKAAETRAEELLLANLTPEQRDEYKRMKRFSVHLPNGKVYRIRKGFAGNVELVEPGMTGRSLKRVESFCIHPAERIPDQDTMLAQKLLLEADEPEFRRIANIVRYR